MEEKKNYYENLYKELQEEDKQFKRQYSLIATWRAIAFLLGVFLVIVGLKDGKSILTAAGVLAFVLFLYFVSKHIKVEQAMKTCHCKAQVVARFVARPAFCIPTSIEIVLLLAVFIPVNIPTRYPIIYPRVLCKNTAINITTPDLKKLAP